MKTAIVIGATGLVGSQLIHLLLADNRFATVKVFARRSLQLKNPKLQEHIIDFTKPGDWKHLVTGDVLFSALGTTLKQAGGKQAQYQVDYTFQYQFAEAASNNGVPVLVLVSSSGANTKSMIFYSRMKGELERDVKQLKFAGIHIIQPGLLAGKRNDERMGEIIGYKILNAINSIGILKKYRPIHAAIVARAMINASLKAAKLPHTYALDEVFNLAEEK